MRKRNNRKKRHSQRKQPFTVPQQTKPSNRSTQAIKINNKGNNKCRQRVSFGWCLEFSPCNVCNLCTVARWCVLGQLPQSTGWKLLRRVYLEQLTHGTLPRVNNRCAGWNASWPAFKVGTSQMLLPLAQGNSWVKMRLFFFFSARKLCRKKHTVWKCRRTWTWLLVQVLIYRQNRHKKMLVL